MLNRIDLRGSRRDPRDLLPRAQLDVSVAVEKIRPVVDAVRTEGFPAIHRYTVQFDGIASKVIIPALIAPILCGAIATVATFLVYRLIQSRRDVDHVIADVLQKDLCTVPDLEAEAALLGRRLTPWLRQAVGDARRGMRSVGEADLRRAIVMAGVPEPEWGAAIETPSGTYFVDAYWRHARVAAEADGAAFHLSAGDWGYDLTRQNAIQGSGVRLFRYPVRRLRADPLSCGNELLLLVA